MNIKLCFSILFSLMCWQLTHAQLGCTDPLANNYNSTATYNNGSCNYNTTSSTLTNFVNLPAQLNEISGNVYYNNTIYGHQDSGGATSIYEVNPTTGAISKTINLLGITNVDWEDMTQDDTHFYIADTGNNINGNRTDLKIYKFAKSLITVGAVINIANSDIEEINFSYEDQIVFTPMGPNNTEFDCEAIGYNRGMLHLFTKNWIGSTTSHYTIPTTAGTYVAKKRETYDVGTIKITGSDFAGYDMLILVGYETVGLINVSAFLVYGFDGTYSYLNSGSVRKIDLGSALINGQVEGISFVSPVECYISNEQLSPFVNQGIGKINTQIYFQPYYAQNQNEINNYFVAQPLTGSIRYNAFTNKIEGFDGTHWNPFYN